MEGEHSLAPLHHHMPTCDDGSVVAAVVLAAWCCRVCNSLFIIPV